MVNELFSWPIRVYLEDTDLGGIVYYVNYLKFMERARTEFLRHIGFDHVDLIQQGRMFVIYSANTHYLRPAVLDDELQVTVEVDKIKRSSVIFNQSVLRCGTQEILTKTEIQAVLVTKDSLKPCAIKTDLATALRAYI